MKNNDDLDFWLSKVKDDNDDVSTEQVSRTTKVAQVLKNIESTENINIQSTENNYL